MRILVVSDTHGDFKLLNQVILSQPKAQTVLHLGDGEEELNEVRLLFPERNFVAVRGNCDFCSDLSDSEEITLDGVKIFMTHGHRYNVKLGFSSVCAKARRKNAKILLFGHTHRAFCEYQSGLYIMNPGSLGMTSTYGTIDIEKNGIFTNIIDLSAKYIFDHNPAFSF